jgi:hypothetical protein
LSDLKKSSRTSTRPQQLAIPENFTEASSLPLGFRPSTLQLNYQNGIGKIEKYLIPEFKENGLSFRDLHLIKTKVAKRIVSLNLLFTIQKAVNVPKSHMDVLGRRVRLTLYDKNLVLSNIYAIPALDIDNEWKFSTKTLFSKEVLGNNTLFVRHDEHNINHCILFELCLIVNDKDTQKVREISCGWTSLPLYNLNGKIIDSKSYELQIFGGAPFSNDTELLETPKKVNFLANLLAVNSNLPTLIVKVSKPSSTTLQKLKYALF